MENNIEIIQTIELLTDAIQDLIYLRLEYEKLTDHIKPDEYNTLIELRYGTYPGNDKVFNIDKVNQDIMNLIDLKSNYKNKLN